MSLWKRSVPIEIVHIVQSRFCTQQGHCRWAWTFYGRICTARTRLEWPPFDLVMRRKPAGSHTLTEIRLALLVEYVLLGHPVGWSWIDLDLSHEWAVAIAEFGLYGHHLFRYNKNDSTMVRYEFLSYVPIENTHLFVHTIVMHEYIWKRYLRILFDFRVVFRLLELLSLHVVEAESFCKYFRRWVHLGHVWYWSCFVFISRVVMIFLFSCWREQESSYTRQCACWMWGVRELA